MKAPAVLLIGSIAANVLLLTAFAVRPTLAPPQFRGWFESTTARDQRHAKDARETARRIKVEEARADAQKARVWAELRSDDLRTLVERLRSAGFPPAIVRGVVSAEIAKRYAGRMRELTGASDDTPFWKPQPRLDMVQMERRSQLMRERSRIMREVLGDDYFASTGVDPSVGQRLQYGDLPKAKIEQVQRIMDDYSEMAADVRAAMRGIMLPEDREKLALLEREKHADLATVLGTQELQDFEMRTSNITMRLKQALTLMDATEQEFRAIYEVQKKYDSLINPGGSGPGLVTSSGEMMAKRQEAQKQVQAELATALGSARAAEYERSSNYEFQQLARSAQAGRYTLDAAVRAYDLRASTAEQSQRIAADTSLSSEQKTAAMVTLAQNTRTQLTATLGTEAGTAYAKSANWLQAIERGLVVTFNGSSTSMRPVTMPPPQPRN